MAKKITEDGEILDEISRTIIARVPPQWKTPWNHDTDAESVATGFVNTEPSKTQQQFLKDSDINEILRKFHATGELPVTGPPNYLNTEKEFDLQDAIVTRAQVEEAWNALPAAVRNVLRDPKTFTDYVDHCLSTGDLDPLRELGLAKPKEAPPAPPEPPKPAPPPGGSPAPDAGKEPPSGSNRDS